MRHRYHGPLTVTPLPDDRRTLMRSVSQRTCHDLGRTCGHAVGKYNDRVFGTCSFEVSILRFGFAAPGYLFNYEPVGDKHICNPHCRLEVSAVVTSKIENKPLHPLHLKIVENVCQLDVGRSCKVHDPHISDPVIVIDKVLPHTVRHPLPTTDRRNSYPRTHDRYILDHPAVRMPDRKRYDRILSARYHLTGAFDTHILGGLSVYGDHLIVRP